MEKSVAKELKKLNKPLILTGVSHHEVNRGGVWFGAMTAVFCFLVMLSIWLGYFMLAVILVLGAIVIFQVAMIAPTKTKAELTGQGISLGATIFSWAAFKTFWLVPSAHDSGTLYLERRDGITMNFHYTKAEYMIMNAYLRTYIPERLQGFTPTLDLLSRWFKL